MVNDKVIVPIKVWFDGGDAEQYVLETGHDPSVTVSYLYERELERELERLDKLRQLYNGEIVETESETINKIWHISRDIEVKRKNKVAVVGYPILSLEHLEELCKGRNDIDCYVALNAGRSSKHIILEEGGCVNVINEIDDTEESFDSLKDMVKNHSSISQAMRFNAFFVYAFEVKEMG